MLANALDNLRLLVSQLVLTLDYPGIALVMVAVAPELVMPFAGFLAVTGEMTLLGVVVAGTVGSVVGSTLPYLLARWLGECRVRSFVRRHGRWLLLFERDLDRALRLFDRYDQHLVLFGRAVPAVRSLISLPAGLLRMPLFSFLFYTALGTALWNATLAYAGVLLGRNWWRVLEGLEVYESLVWLALGLMLLVFFTRRVRRLLASA
ncbi:MAG: DedA family protein [Deinococcota bacterium]|nr:DedA family protein [Deinococcota bacterium]